MGGFGGGHLGTEQAGKLDFGHKSLQPAGGQFQLTKVPGRTTAIDSNSAAGLVSNRAFDPKAHNRLSLSSLDGFDPQSATSSTQASPNNAVPVTPTGSVSADITFL